MVSIEPSTGAVRYLWLVGMPACRMRQRGAKHLFVICCIFFWCIFGDFFVIFFSSFWFYNEPLYITMFMVFCLILIHIAFVPLYLSIDFRFVFYIYFFSFPFKGCIHPNIKYKETEVMKFSQFYIFFLIKFPFPVNFTWFACQFAFLFLIKYELRMKVTKLEYF